VTRSEMIECFLFSFSFYTLSFTSSSSSSLPSQRVPQLGQQRALLRSQR